KEFPQTVFIIAGEDMGVKKTIYAQAVKLNVQNNILFTGYIADEEMFHSAYSACDVFVLPSEYEAFGIVLLEAMACGKPCVATDVGGVSEIVDEKTGVLVDYGDRDGLAHAIIDLLGSERKRNEMGMAGREKVRTRFTWDKTVDALEETYRSLIS
ncbi:MAG: glycosyltransferase family 4 protein, partial [Candidatus Thermoplasmatota archaeon]|nr:glycosyltransferase family 4 protein [Candidatus Thermoplasmatota archaeon]